MNSCKKTNIQPTTHPIQGLWIGTYVVSAPDLIYQGQSFFFSFSIYSDGTMVYKGNTPGDIVYASGTWSLTGNTFSFKVTTLNYAGGYQHTQTGTATYNSSDGTLSNGTITDQVTGGKGTWSLSRID